jgi:hypothetical protein
MYRTVLAATLTVMLVVVGFAVVVPTADAQCGPKGQDPCPPPKGVLCHNIGGPRELGANCDVTGNCSFETLEGVTITIPANHFLGIVIGFNQDSDGALAAHIAHGDGFADMTWSPAFHVASTGQIHQASNVECAAERILPLPEPGN